MGWGRASAVVSWEDLAGLRAQLRVGTRGAQEPGCLVEWGWGASC